MSLKKQKSNNSFKNRLEQWVQEARWSPSGGNTQPWKAHLFVKDKTVKVKLEKKFKMHHRQLINGGQQHLPRWVVLHSH